MRFLRGSLKAILFASAAYGMVTPIAYADLRICNKTESRVGVAVGYKVDDDWTTEGWWNIGAKSCQVILAGTLSSRYYYFYAVDYDQGGEWGDRNYPMCTRDKEFTIKGAKNCVARGYKKTGFKEVDTGDQAGWTIQLEESTNRGVGGR